MKITRIHTTAGGGSAFEDIEVPEDSGHLILRFSSELIRVHKMAAGAFGDFHTTPVGPQGDLVLSGRQCALILGGRLEIGTTDGAKRQFGPGQIVVSDNREGRGHTTRVLEGPLYLMHLQLHDSLDFQRGTD